MNRYDDVMRRLNFSYVVDSPPSVSPKMIRDFETEIGYQLPADYREFLGVYGYSRFRKVFSPLRQYSDNDGVLVEIFYGLGLKSGYHLLDIRDTFLLRPDTAGPARLLPESILAIAQSPGGQICLDLDGDRGSSIFWWPSQGFADDDDYDIHDIYNNVTVLAPNFDQFVYNLRLPNS